MRQTGTLLPISAWQPSIQFSRNQVKLLKKKRREKSGSALSAQSQANGSRWIPALDFTNTPQKLSAPGAWLGYITGELHPTPLIFLEK